MVVDDFEDHDGDAAFEEHGDYFARVEVWVRAHNAQPGCGGYASGHFGGTGLFYGEQSAATRRCLCGGLARRRTSSNAVPRRYDR
jgi:hypothetical protein